MSHKIFSLKSYCKTPLVTAALLALLPVSCDNSRKELEALAEHYHPGNGEMYNHLQRIMEGGDVNALAGETTALALAVTLKDEKAVDLLLQLGASPDVKCGKNNSAFPLKIAAANGNDAIASRLIKAGASVNLTDDDDGRTALYAAAENGHASTLKLLIDHGGDVKATDNSNETLLHAAARGNSPETTTLLLAAGLDPNARDKAGDTPLVCYYPNSAIVSQLIAAGADVTASNEYGNTVLHAMSEFYQHGDSELIELILIKGANPNAANAKGWTPLHLLCNLAGRDQDAAVECLALLLKHGADPSLKTKDGRTALKIAGTKHNERLAEALQKALAPSTGD